MRPRTDFLAKRLPTIKNQSYSYLIHWSLFKQVVTNDTYFASCLLGSPKFPYKFDFEYCL